MAKHSNNSNTSKARSSFTRRRFLRAGAGSAIGFTVLPSYLALGKEDSEGNLPPSKRINYAAIGTGGRGRKNAETAAKAGAALVASCDVEFKGLDPKDENNKPRYTDFRTMLDKHEKDIDAVVISSPDHTHYVATIDAMRRGKHVYVEKPLTHTFKESELLMQAAEKYDVVTQMGNQGHTSSGSNQFQELVKAGVIQDIVRIDAYMDLPPSESDRYHSYRDPSNRLTHPPTAEEIPENLDWDSWCGPIGPLPYSKLYHPRLWRGLYNTGAGLLGDIGAHLIDFAHDWLELGYPTRIEVLDQANHNAIQFPSSAHLCLKFPARGEGLPACDVFWKDGADTKPVIDEKYLEKPKNDEPVQPNLPVFGTILHRRQEDYLIERGSHVSVSRLLPRAKMRDFKEVLKAQAPEHDHMSSFMQACLGNAECTSPFSKGAPLTQALILGTIAQRLNRSLDFDPATKRFVNDAEANALLEGGPVRESWKHYYTL